MMVDGVNLNETSITLDSGDTFQIRATVVSGNPDKSVTYTSANPSVATVDEKGLVTGVGRGETVITVTNPATGMSAELTVKVSKTVNVRNVLPRYVMPEQYLSTIERAPGTSRQYLGQPDMIRTQSGRLITAYPIGHGKGPLVMRTSEDGGITWTEKGPIEKMISTIGMMVKDILRDTIIMVLRSVQLKTNSNAVPYPII